LSLSANAQFADKYSKVRIKCDNFNELSETGVGILGGSIDKSGYFEGEIACSDTLKLSAHGFSYSVIIDDITEFYIQRNSENLVDNSKNIVYNCGQPKEYTTPVNYHSGSMGGYFTYDEAIVELDNMHT
jgi:hypothetical protein